jgi:heat shock protein HtpX
MKRIVLFVLTNLAVMAVLSIVLKLFGIDRALAQQGLNHGALLAFSAVFGFGGAIISLLISKPMAKWTAGARVIDGSEGSTERWLVQSVRTLAERAGIGMPEVAVYDGPPNAFATGAFKNSALVAVSTGLLQSMNQEEVEAVLAHEVAHVANGDMVTLALIQGVLNTFVIFLARVVGTLVDRAVFRSERGTGPGYYITVFVLEMVPGSRAAASSAPIAGRPSTSVRRNRCNARSHGWAVSSRARCPKPCAPSASPIVRAGWHCSRVIRRSSSASPR